MGLKIWIRWSKDHIGLYMVQYGVWMVFWWDFMKIWVDEILPTWFQHIRCVRNWRIRCQTCQLLVGPASKFLELIGSGSWCQVTTGTQQVGYGGFVNCGYPSHHPFQYRVSHCKPSILEYPHFRKPPIWLGYDGVFSTTVPSVDNQTLLETDKSLIWYFFDGLPIWMPIEKGLSSASQKSNDQVNSLGSWVAYAWHFEP